MSQKIKHNIDTPLEEACTYVGIVLHNKVLIQSHWLGKYLEGHTKSVLLIGGI